MTDVVIVVAAVVEHTVLPVAVEVPVAGRAGIMGTVGCIASSVTGPVVGDTLIIGTAAAELTPRLPISTDPSGIPVRATPPGVNGMVEVGVEDEAMLADPEPHIPDIPEVSTAAAEVGNTVEPDVAADIPDMIDVVVVLDVGPAATPPPSKVAVDPNMVDGAVPMVEQIMPLLDIVIVEVPSGLTPGDAISVEPSGIWVGPTGAPGPIPSGDVMLSDGVGATAPTWANAGLHISAHADAMTTKHFIDASCRWSSMRAVRRSCDRQLSLREFFESRAGTCRSDAGLLAGDCVF